jgi:putative spermidine/putrescine transport system permease protein
VTSAPHVERPPRRNPGRRLSTFFVRHEWARLGGLLAAPLGWMLVIYLGSLFVLFLAAFWSIGGILGTEIVHTWTLDNFREIFDEPVYRDVAVRTITMAIYVTIADAVLAFPLAYYMARVATPRSRNILVVAVLMPMLASYLVKAYIWRTMLGQQGIINWLLSPFGLEIQGKSTFGLWLAFTYLWLPLMILPIYAGLERIPNSLLEASADLGARSLRTFWKVTVPLVFPALVAGSIFTFSLTLGDYILPSLIADQQFIGTLIYGDRGTNLPVAAAYAMVPVAVMTAYLLVAKRLGAFESL